MALQAESERPTLTKCIDSVMVMQRWLYSSQLPVETRGVRLQTAAAVPSQLGMPPAEQKLQGRRARVLLQRSRQTEAACPDTPSGISRSKKLLRESLICLSKHEKLKKQQQNVKL